MKNLTPLEEWKRDQTIIKWIGRGAVLIAVIATVALLAA